MTELWDQFCRRLHETSGIAVDAVLRATPAELEDIFTQQGYRSLERAQLRTVWYSKQEKAGLGDVPMVAQTTVVPSSSREFADVKVLLEHYICPDPSMAVSIVELERINNPVLRKRFDRRKNELSDGVSGVVVRRFHSPVSCNNAKIQDLGFSLPAEGPQLCLRFLTKAPASHAPGAYKLLLCDVAVGKYKAVSGDCASITPEQLVSEAFDSVYLFYSGSKDSGEVGTTPDEFILFNPDQVLPRHVVTFLVHVSLASPSHSPLRSPSSTHNTSVVSREEVKRELSFTEQGSKQPQHPVKYWLPAENQLVDGDSLLVGEHRGKKFVSLHEGTERQATVLADRNQTLLESIEHLKAQLKELDVAREKHEQAESGVVSLVKAQTQLLQDLLIERRDEAIRQVEESTSTVLSGLADDYSAIAGLLETLEGYAIRVHGMLQLSQTEQEEFLLRSEAFLQGMSNWTPPYSVQTTMSLPPPADMVFETDAVHRALEGLCLVEMSVRSKQRSETEGVVVVQHGVSPGRRSRGRRGRTPERRSGTPKSKKPPQPPAGRKQLPPPYEQNLWEESPAVSLPHPPPHTAAPPLPPPAVTHPPGSRPGSRSTTPNRRTGRSRSRTKVPSFFVVLAGDPAVGKTRLMDAWRSEDQPSRADLELYSPTLEPHSETFTVITSKGKLSITVTDTPGSQLCPEALTTADAAVVVFDCTNHGTYENVAKWYSYLPQHIPVVLCGNKSNENARVIRSSDIRFHLEVNAKGKEKSMNYYDISVSTRYNVDKPWTWICRKLMKDSHLVVKEIISSR